MSNPHACVKLIHETHQTNAKIGIILGSGSGDIADSLTDTISFDYQDLPGFHFSPVAGHKGKLIIGKLSGVDVVCLQGRAHYYQGASYDEMKTMIRTLKLLGCETLISTNASGSLNLDIRPGDLMLINDHINLQPHNPLVGPNDDEFGERFFPLDNAYDKTLRKKMTAIAEKLDIKLPQGVYLGLLGPNYETPAEIRAFKMLGVDAVGMSTVPDIIIANHCGMKCLAIAAISNMACGLSDEDLTHDNVIDVVSKASDKIKQLITELVKELNA